MINEGKLREIAETLNTVNDTTLMRAKKIFLPGRLNPLEKGATCDKQEVNGMEMIVRNYVPSNEIWLVDEKGDVLQKVICLIK